MQREEVYNEDNKADYVKDSPIDKNAKALAAVIAEIKTLAAKQTSGFDDKRQAFEMLGAATDDLEDIMERINLAARASADEVEGIEEKFRLPYKPSIENLIAKANSFAADAPAYEAKLIEQELPADFIEILTTRTAIVETAADRTDSATEKHGGATAALKDAFRRGMAISKKHDALVKLKYRDNPQKLGAWTIASHLERRPKPAHTENKIEDKKDSGEEK